VCNIAGFSNLRTPPQSSPQKGEEKLRIFL